MSPGLTSGRRGATRCLDLASTITKTITKTITGTTTENFIPAVARTRDYRKVCRRCRAKRTTACCRQVACLSSCLDGKLDSTTPRWLWVIKWLLIIPQVVLLALPAVGLFFAWIGAFVAIFFTGFLPETVVRLQRARSASGWGVSFSF
jgi:hypothetical protein